MDIKNQLNNYIKQAYPSGEINKLLDEVLKKEVEVNVNYLKDCNFDISSVLTATEI